MSLLLARLGGGTNYTLNLSDTVTMSDVFDRVVTFIRSVADTATPTDAAAKTVGKPLADTATSTDALVKALAKAATDTATISDAAAKTVGKAPADTATISDSPAKMVGKAASDTTTISDALIKAVGKAPTDSISMSDSPIVTLTPGGGGPTIFIRPIDLSHFDHWDRAILPGFGVY